MQEEGLLLVADEPSMDDLRAEKLLEFFGVPYQKQRASDFRFSESSSTENSRSQRLMCSAQTFGRIAIDLHQFPHGLNSFGPQTHSVFLYSNGDSIALASVVRQLSGTTISVGRGGKAHTEWRIADEPGSPCGAMRGLNIYPAVRTLSRCDFVDTKKNDMTALIASNDRVAFLKLSCGEIPFFISSGSLLDIDAELTTQNFDIRDHLFSAVPAVSYIRWAFPQSSWSAPEASACLVIDDPLLKPRYGFVRFEKLLSLMKQLRFSTSIAFIPWNWRRSDPKVVQLFKDNPDRYSLCVHGCDHTAAEFRASDRHQLRWITSQAVNRMSLHEGRTGLQHDRVMIFPQGVFSAAATAELKRAGFHAAVNTEVHSSPHRPHELRICDVWDVAVMKYNDFPIFSRRYPTQGVENFAFDLLLGKPCLIVIHHDFCGDGYVQLSQFIEQLNSLKVPIVWRCLGDVLKRSYRQKQVSQDLVQIEMYGSELLVENRSGRSKKYLIRRREDHPHDIDSLHAGPRPVSWKSFSDYIEFELKLRPGESVLLTLRFKADQDVAQAYPNFVHSAKTTLRRHLSEMRDNYFVPARARMTAFSRQ